MIVQAVNLPTDSYSTHSDGDNSGKFVPDDQPVVQYNFIFISLSGNCAVYCAIEFTSWPTRNNWRNCNVQLREVNIIDNPFKKLTANFFINPKQTIIVRSSNNISQANFLKHLSPAFGCEVSWINKRLIELSEWYSELHVALNWMTCDLDTSSVMLKEE